MDTLIKDTKNNKVYIVYLLSNCGIELLNEIWAYDINKDLWYFIKPFLDLNLKIQQKPSPRYGHSAVYIEKLDNNVLNKAVILRKYMFIYGGFSIYCENACNDFWMYEIAYAPIRYYPNTPNASKGNIWTQIFPSTKVSPGKRIFHSMIVDSKFKYIYLYGGLSLDNDNKYIINNDLWRYDISLNMWQKIYTMGISQITRTVKIFLKFLIKIIYWDGTIDTFDIDYLNYNRLTDVVEYNFITNNPKTKIPSKFSYVNKKKPEHLQI